LSSLRILKIDWGAWWRLPRKLRFLLAGGYNTVFGYLVFGALFFALGKTISYLLIALLAHLISLVNAFVVHRRLVFRSTGQWRASFIRFNLSQLSSLAFGMTCLYALVEFGRIKPLAAQALAMMITVPLTYLLHRRFSFGDRSATR
jgi:putative flippase GtrA